MTKNQKHIRIGFFENFKGENSILISVDIYGLLELEEIFLKLSHDLTSFDFKDLKFLDKKFKIGLHALNEQENIGLVKISSENFEWKVTKEKWGEFREKTTALYRLGTEGHQYLGSDSTDNQDLQVVLSFNEYDKKFWKQRK